MSPLMEVVEPLAQATPIINPIREAIIRAVTIIAIIIAATMAQAKAA